jgi:erythromycin esterase-like protein
MWWLKEIREDAGWIAGQSKDRRKEHMDILELPQFVKDVVQLANDVKAAQAVLAPQFPQLVADAEKIKEDGEKLLGIAYIPGTSAPPAGQV